MRKYIIFEGVHPYSKYVFNDLRNETDCYLISANLRGFWGKINRVHTSVKVNTKVKLPLKNIWYSQYIRSLNNIVEGDEYIIIFSESNRLAYDSKFVN